MAMLNIGIRFMLFLGRRVRVAKTELYPYQLVAFLSDEPEVGESAYNSPNGWYSQIALKRRFNVLGKSEDQIVDTINNFCAQNKPFEIIVGGPTKTDRMPVMVLPVQETNEVMKFHANFIAHFGDQIVSRYPERDGPNYYPHITAEYEGRVVIDVNIYANKSYKISKVWLLKDAPDTFDSLALCRFELGDK
jgi:hypothetical protein